MPANLIDAKWEVHHFYAVSFLEERIGNSPVSTLWGPFHKWEDLNDFVAGRHEEVERIHEAAELMFFIRNTAWLMTAIEIGWHPD